MGNSFISFDQTTKALAEAVFIHFIQVFAVHFGSRMVTGVSDNATSEKHIAIR
jgi:hypothetical protein